MSSNTHLKRSHYTSRLSAPTPLLGLPYPSHSPAPSKAQDLSPQKHPTQKTRDPNAHAHPPKLQPSPRRLTSPQSTKLRSLIFQHSPKDALSLSRDVELKDVASPGSRATLARRWGVSGTRRFVACNLTYLSGLAVAMLRYKLRVSRA